MYVTIVSPIGKVGPRLGVMVGEGIAVVSEVTEGAVHVAVLKELSTVMSVGRQPERVTSGKIKHSKICCLC